MSWIFLLIASLFEVVWAFSLKASDGFSRLTPSLITVSTMIASFWFLALAMRSLPLGTAYAMWTGLGAVGAFTAGVVFLNEALTLERLMAISLIVAGLVLLKLSATA